MIHTKSCLVRIIQTGEFVIVDTKIVRLYAINHRLYYEWELERIYYNGR